MMRRLCVALMALLLLMTWGGALAEADYDFSGMGLDELYDIRARLDTAIARLEAAGGAHHYEDGSYLVGRDLPEGDYTLQEMENAVFASVAIRTEDSSDSALILHKLISGQVDVHLAKDTWVTLSEARAYPLGTEPSRISADGEAGEGAYLVGVQLAPGQYDVIMDDKAPLSSYSVYSGILGTDAKLTRFEVLHEQTELTLEEGEYVELSGCLLTPPNHGAREE